MMKRLVIIVVLFSILVASSSMNRAYAAYFYSPSNAWIGDNSSNPLCTQVYNPKTTIVFNSEMLTTAATAKQWSTQVNLWPPPAEPNNIDWMQTNMAIDFFGNVYGSEEMWTQPGMVWDSGHHQILNVGTVAAGEKFKILDHTTSITRLLNYANFSYYHSGAWHTTKVDIPSAYQAHVISWQLNIAGENYGSNSYATFTSGSGQITYSSSQSEGVTWNANEPSTSCQSHGAAGTAETGDMSFGQPAVVSNTVSQGFNYLVYLTMNCNNGGNSCTPGNGWHDPNGGTFTLSSVSPSPSCAYQWGGWTGTGSWAYTGSLNNPTMAVYPGSNGTETANWLPINTCPQTLTMSISSGVGSTSPPVGANSYTHGTQVQITATGGTCHWQFNGWSGSGSGSYTGPNNPSTVTMNGDISESTSFVYTVTCPHS